MKKECVVAVVGWVVNEAQGWVPRCGYRGSRKKFDVLLAPFWNFSGRLVLRGQELAKMETVNDRPLLDEPR